MIPEDRRFCKNKNKNSTISTLLLRDFLLKFSTLRSSPSSTSRRGIGSIEQPSGFHHRRYWRIDCCVLDIAVVSFIIVVVEHIVGTSNCNNIIVGIKNIDKNNKDTTERHCRERGEPLRKFSPSLSPPLSLVDCRRRFFQRHRRQTLRKNLRACTTVFL